MRWQIDPALASPAVAKLGRTEPGTGKIHLFSP